MKTDKELMECLLAPEAQRPFAKLEQIGYGDITVTEEHWDIDGLLKAQLEHAIPIIRKAERERVIAVINDLNSIGYPYGGNYKEAILQALRSEALYQEERK